MEKSRHEKSQWLMYYVSPIGCITNIPQILWGFIEKLNELDTSEIEPLTSIAETKLQLRHDKIKSENIREQILKNSPNENKDFFVVPKVVE